jgi:hypothetical protein
MAGNILGTLLLNIVAKSNTSGLDKTDRALRKVNRSARTTAGGMGFLSRLSGGIFGGINFSQISSWFMSYLQFEKNLGSIHSRFYAITKDTKLANEEFEYARRISKETATNLMDVADSYSIFYASASRALGKQGAKEVYENWTKVARVLHVSGEQYKSIMYAQREMSSKGKLYAQDLLIQMGTHVPDVRDLALKAIQNLGIKGVDTIAKFQKYTEKNPSTDIMGKFMLEMSREAKRRFASDEALKNALKMPDALATRIEIILQDFLIEFSEKGGGVAIVKILQGIANALLKIDYEKLATTLGNMAKTLSNIFDYLPKILTVLRDIAISIAVLTIFSKIGKAWAWFNTAGGLLRGGIFGGIIKAFGFKEALSWAIKELAAKLFLGTTFKAALAAGVNAIPVIGQILSVLLTIWTVVDIIRAIMPRKEKENVAEMLAKAGIKPETLYNTAKKLDEDKKMYGGSNLELRRHAAGYLGNDIGNRFTYNDKGQIVIQFNGNFLTLEDIKKELGQSSAEVEKVKDSKKGKFFNRPKTLADYGY